MGAPDVPGPWQLTLHQNHQGYRFALDAFLLADFVPATTHSPYIDLGTGCGVIALLLARRFPQAQIVGLELQTPLVALAQANTHRNGLASRVAILQADIRQAATLFPAGAFATVVCNPPYRALGQGRLNPHQEKAMARHEVALTLVQLVQAARHLLGHRGRLLLTYHPARLSELCVCLEEAALRPHRLRLIHPTAQSAATMVLVEAVRAGRDALTVLPPLFVYTQADVYSAEMHAIFQGRGLQESYATR